MRILSAALAVLCALQSAAQSLTVTTFAGNRAGPGYTDGTSAFAQFGYYNLDVASDANGNVYVADGENFTVRRIAPDGTVTTFAGLAGASGFLVNGRGGAARFTYARSIAVDPSGNVYVEDNDILRKISPQGVVSTFGSAWNPIATDRLGNVYGVEIVGGSSFGITKVNPSGVSSLIPNSTSANWPTGMAINAAGEIYVARGGTIDKITSAGVVSPVPTSVFAFGLAFEASGDLLITTYNTNTIVRKTPSGQETTIAGANNQQGSTDGPALDARFVYPSGITVTPSGAIYVTEVAARVRKIASGIVSTIGRDPEPGSNDGTLETARFNHPSDIVGDGSGNFYVADTFSRTIRKITSGGQVTTFAGTAGQVGTADGTGAAARFFSPVALAIDSSGNLFVAEDIVHTIRKITPAGVVTTFAGSPQNSGAVDGTGTAARFFSPQAIAIDASDNLYVADRLNHAIRKITPAGVVTTFAGTMGSAGNTEGTGTAARFTRPYGITIDGGNLFVTANYAVRKITLPGAVVTTWAGVSGTRGSLNGTGTAARFDNLSYVTSDGAGNLFVRDNTNIRKIDSGAAVTTAILPQNGCVDGTGTIARLFVPLGMWSDHAGKLYIADSYGSNIRLARLPGIDDIATTSASSTPINTVVQLGTSPDTAASWQWSIVRRPSGSVAELSATNIKNPTFTPDVADLYTFLLRAEGPAGVRYSTIDVSATDSCDPLASVVASMTSGSPESCVDGNGGTASVAVNGGGSVTIQWGWRATPDGTTHPIGGATSSSYIIHAADFESAGTKYLVASVTSSCGVTLVSNAIEVTINTPPAVTISASTAVYSNAAFNYATASDAGPGATYSWSIANGAISGGANTRTLEYTAGFSGEVTLTVTVTKGGCVTMQQVNVPIMNRPAGATMLHLVTPCRVVDTRDVGGAIENNTTRNVAIGGLCGVPVGAKAVALNITAIAPPATGFLALYPSNAAWPGNSTLNYRAGKVRANNAVVSIAPDGTLTVKNVGATTHFLIDVTGYFQ